LDEKLLQSVIRCIAEENGSAVPAALAKRLRLSERKITAALQRLHDAGAVETVASTVRIVGSVESGVAIETAAEQHEVLREAKKQRLQKMREYAELTTCRREMLLQYFGDALLGPCGNCDNCEAAAGRPPVDPKAGTRREVV
jgi:ATP-dependent DNA helicase RecQ